MNNQFVKNFNYNKVFIFILFAMIIQYIQYQVYFFDKYLDATSRIQGHKFNFSTYYKDILWILALTIGYYAICFLIYICYYIYKVPLFSLAGLITFIYLFWDLYPVFMLDNAIKEIPILLFDAFFAGGLWVLITIPLFNKYYSVKNNVPILLITNVFLILLIIYRFYTYNRVETENNRFVKFGDKLKDLIMK